MRRVSRMSEVDGLLRMAQAQAKGHVTQEMIDAAYKPGICY